MARGGLRAKAGRPPGSPNKVPQERAERIASTGQTPLDVLVEVMRFCRANLAIAQQNNEGKDIQRVWAIVTAKIAADAAPYVHSKMPTALQVSGDPDNPLTMVNRIERVLILDSVQDAKNTHTPNLPAPY